MESHGDVTCVRNKSVCSSYLTKFVGDLTGFGSAVETCWRDEQHTLVSFSD